MNRGFIFCFLNDNCSNRIVALLGKGHINFGQNGARALQLFKRLIHLLAIIRRVKVQLIHPWSIHFEQANVSIFNQTEAGNEHVEKGLLRFGFLPERA